jgi:hypothetical protein
MAYNGYQGQCVGRLLKFLHEYARSSIADYCIFHSCGKITHMGDNGPVIASGYTWNNDGDGDIPHFTFVGDFEYLNVEQERKKDDILRVEEMLGKLPYSKEKEQSKREEQKRLYLQKLRNEILKGE